jgi:hypothetical protein
MRWCSTFMRRQGALAVLVFTTTSSMAPAERLLFLDQADIVEKRGVERRLHAPQRAGTVFTFDAPWEGGESGYAAVMTAEDGSFRMIYRGGGETSAREVTCVATSPDGVTWTRPSLGLVEFEGSRDNNIIWTANRRAYGESHNFFGFLDTRPGIPESERWKGLGLGWREEGPDERFRALVPFTSPDGLNWTLVTTQPVIWQGRGFDSQNVAFWDPSRERYLCFSRSGLEGYRHIQVCESEDFQTWTEPRQVIFDPIAHTQFYTNAITPLPSLQEDDKAPWYVGMPMRFVPERKQVQGRVTDGTSDAVLIASRDGLHFTWSPREAWIRPGLNPDNWGNAHGNMTPLHGILQTSDDQWSVYWIEDYGSSAPKVQRGTMRPEGFLSLHAGETPGVVRLGPVQLDGCKLLLNASTAAAGTIRVAVVNEAGEPQPGLALEDCEPLWGDGLFLPVRWKDGREMLEGVGEEAYLELELKDADVFAVRVVK